MINFPIDRQPKKNSFVLVSTDLGTVIINHNDYKFQGEYKIGVGHQMLERSAFDAPEINVMLQILTLCRQYRGDGVVMFDAGANIGAYTIAAARTMINWGEVIAVEAQERLFYALAGNIVINNLSNAKAIWSALSDKKGTIDISIPNYDVPASYGSLELIQKETSENIGQLLEKTQEVPSITIDSLKLNRCDYLKLDVESMEELVLAGAKKTIKSCKPIVQIEVIKSDREKIQKFFEQLDYIFFNLNGGYDYLCMHKDDPIQNHLNEN